MKYTKSLMVSGKWAKAAEIKSGIKAKIVSETNPQPSSFTNKDGSVKEQDVCKVIFEDKPSEQFNVSLNRATVNGLIDAFGEESADWMNKYLTVETEKMRVAGKAVTALYLIPENYKRIDDANGYAMIVPKDVQVESETMDMPEEEEIDVKSIPF